MISLLLASAFTSLNPLDIALDVRRTRAVHDVSPCGTPLHYRLSPPKDGGRALMADIAKTDYAPPVGIVGAPQHVFAEFKRLGKGFALFLLNYNPDVKVKGVSLKASAGRRVRFTPILEGDSVPSALAPSSEGVFPLPTFTRGAIVEIE